MKCGHPRFSDGRKRMSETPWTGGGRSKGGADVEFAEFHGWGMDYRAAVALQRRLAQHLDRQPPAG